MTFHQYMKYFSEALLGSGGIDDDFGQLE